jgi:hypothetical protein
MTMQVDMSVTRKYGGTGLGLNIVKQLVSAHDGVIKCDSKEGQGTVFTLKLPVLQGIDGTRPSLDLQVSRPALSEVAGSTRSFGEWAVGKGWSRAAANWEAREMLACSGRCGWIGLRMLPGLAAQTEISVA